MSGDRSPGAGRPDQDADIARLTEALHRGAAKAGEHFRGQDRPDPRSDASTDASRLHLAEAMITARRRTAEHFKTGLFADPARDLLLDLYVAALRKTDVAVSGACIAAAVPATTALRWIDRLRQDGLIAIEEDERDQRRILVRLNDEAMEGMDRYLTDALALLRPAA